MMRNARPPRLWIGLLLSLLLLAACGGESTRSVGGSLATNQPSAPAVAATAAPLPAATPLPPTVAVASVAPTVSAPPTAPATVALTAGIAPSASARTGASTGSPTRTTSAATASVASGSLKIETRNALAIAEPGRFDAIGELVNTGGLDGRLNKITVTLRDAAGKTVASGNSTATGLEVLPAGQHTVFQVALSPRVDTWQDVQVQVEAVAATAAMKNSYVTGLKVEKLSAPAVPTGTTSGMILSGEFVNGSTVRSGNPVITVAGYDEGGKLTHYGRVAGLINWLVPGATTPFSVEFYVGPDTAPTRYEYWAYASKSALVDTPFLLEASVAGTSDGLRRSYFGTVRNPSPTDVSSLQISVTLYGGDGNVVGASQSIVRGAELLAPGAQTVWASYMSAVVGDVKEVKVQIYAMAPSAAERQRLYPELVASAVTFVPVGSAQFPRQTISGQVTNGGTGVAYLLTVVIGVYDADGKLIAVTSGSVTPGELGPGASGTFALPLDGLATPPPKYDLIIRAVRKT